MGLKDAERVKGYVECLQESWPAQRWGFILHRGGEKTSYISLLKSSYNGCALSSGTVSWKETLLLSLSDVISDTLNIISHVHVCIILQTCCVCCLNNSPQLGRTTPQIRNINFTANMSNWFSGERSLEGATDFFSPNFDNKDKWNLIMYFFHA